VIVTSDWELESATPGVERWMADLPEGEWDAGRLPSVVLAVAAQALRSAEGRDAPGEVALARVLTRSGRWVVLHGATLVSAGQRRIAVIVEPAHPARIGPLLMSAYGLTDREQDVTRLVLQGESTAAIAESLVVSVHTVQQHLKNIFEKIGVRSRRDLVGKVFFSYYEPRLRDNESRVPQDKPLRGGPMVHH
jgi:DNA-binding CsgD family transcriptional regulator